MAVEALLNKSKRPDEVKCLVKEFKEKVKQSRITTKDSIIGQLSGLEYQSIMEAACALTHRLIPNEEFEGKSSVKFFKDSYDVRSDIVHKGKVKKSVDIINLANEMEKFVHQLLLAEMNIQPAHSVTN